MLDLLHPLPLADFIVVRENRHDPKSDKYIEQFHDSADGNHYAHYRDSKRILGETLSIKTDNFNTPLANGGVLVLWHHPATLGKSGERSCRGN